MSSVKKAYYVLKTQCALTYYYKLIFFHIFLGQSLDLEVACTFDSHLAEAFMAKIMENHSEKPSQSWIIRADYLFSYLAAWGKLTGWSEGGFNNVN